MAKIAIDAGFLYGSQIPETFYFPIYFADQDWKKPNREVYIDGLAKHKPRMATVLDWERPDQLSEVIGWSEMAAVHVETVIIIPKVHGGVSRLPRTVGGADVRLGYSVPTNYGGTELPIWEFSGWPVHLLGGSPHRQMELAQYMDVRSTDGNMAQMMAVRYCQFWTPGNARYASNRWWPTLREANDGEKWPGDNAHHEAFRRSCENVMRAWRS
jgi:hypothetical protein